MYRSRPQIHQRVRVFAFAGSMMRSAGGDDSGEDAANGLRTTVDGSISVTIEYTLSLPHRNVGTV